MFTLNTSKPTYTAFKTCALATLSISSFIVMPDVAIAGTGDDIFGTTSPFKAFTDFITGPFAYFVAIVAIVVFGAMLVSGSDFSGLSRRAPMILLAIGIILGAKTIIDKLYGGTSGAIYEEIQTRDLNRNAIDRGAPDA